MENPLIIMTFVCSFVQENAWVSVLPVAPQAAGSTVGWVSRPVPKTRFFCSARFYVEDFGERLANCHESSVQASWPQGPFSGRVCSQEKNCSKNFALLLGTRLR